MPPFPELPPFEPLSPPPLEPAVRRARRGRRWSLPVLVLALGLATLAGAVLVHAPALAPRAASSPPAAPLTGLPPQRTTTPGSIHVPWFWLGGEPAGPWRLPERGRGIAIADPDHAIAVTETAMYVIDLRSGAVSRPEIIMPTGSWISAVARVGARVIAFGRAGDRPAAWALSVSPPSAVSLALTDPHPLAPTGLTDGGVAVSPDGKRVIVCTDVRWPTVRDARTLAAQRVVRVSCGSVRFTDATHAVLTGAGEAYLLDVTTGALSEVPADAPLVVPGPGGQVFEATAERFTIRGPYGLLREQEVRVWDAPAWWTRDGARVVSVGFGAVTIRDAVDPSGDRTVTIPSWPSLDVALDSRTLLLLRGTVVLAVDLATGTLRQPVGDLSGITEVAPHDGTVITVADRVRVHTRDDVTGEAAGSSLAGGGASALLAVVDDMTVALWNPATGARRQIAAFDNYVIRVARAGDEMIAIVADRLERVDGVHPPTRWVTLRDLGARGGLLEAVDPAGERFAVQTDGAWHVVEPGTRSVWSVQVEIAAGLCGSGTRLTFAPDGSWFGVEANDRIIVFDPARRVRVGELPLGSGLASWTFLPTGEVLIARPEQLELWDPSTTQSRVWSPPTSEFPGQLAVSADGRELAVQYTGDRVLWADLAQLRAHATSRGVVPMLPSVGCSAAPAHPLTYAEIVAD